MQVTVHLEAGSASLKRSEWASVHPATTSPWKIILTSQAPDKTRILITMHGQPLFRAKIKQGAIKILEFPLYYEVESTMKDDEDDDDDFDFEDEDEDDHSLQTMMTMKTKMTLRRKILILKKTKPSIADVKNASSRKKN